MEKRTKEKRQADLRHKKRDLEIEEGKHRIKKKVWKQRIKHLLYENQNEITLLQTESEIALKKEHDTYTELNKELKLDKRSLHIGKKEMELFHNDALKALMQGQDRSITKLRQEYEQKVGCWCAAVGNVATSVLFHERTNEWTLPLPPSFPPSLSLNSRTPPTTKTTTSSAAALHSRATSS